MDKFLNKIKEKKLLLILGLILIAGIFLRTYRFREWLVFNPDQARDAMLIEKALKNSSDIPLLGPEAGNTRFQLGPIFYYFEYASAKIFGDTPWAMAYPDLLFSIATIVLFYFFARKYFSRNISLSLTAVLSFSFFAIRYSRFAMNTNSIPFFTLLFLFSSLELLNPKNKNNYWRPLVFGIAIGVGIQLHALLLISMPVMALLILALIIKRKMFSWKTLAIVILACVVLNLGQVIYDIKFNGANSHLFISSATKKSGTNNFLRNIQMDAMYQIQSNVHMLSSLGNQNDCDFQKIINRIVKDKAPYSSASNKIAAIFAMALAALFSLGGYLLIGYFFRKEKDQNRRNFLFIVAIYSVILFFVTLPVIQEASMRYFIILLYLPLIFLGLWMRFFLSKNRKVGEISSILMVAFLLIFNITTIKKTASRYQSKTANDISNAILGEIEPMASYIVNQSKSQGKAYITGNRLYAIRFYKPLLYITQKQNVSLARIDSEKNIKPNIPIFYIKDASSSKKESYGGQLTSEITVFGNIMIMKFEN